MKLQVFEWVGSGGVCVCYACTGAYARECMCVLIAWVSTSLAQTCPGQLAAPATGSQTSLRWWLVT